MNSNWLRASPELSLLVVGFESALCVIWAISTNCWIQACLACRFLSIPLCPSSSPKDSFWPTADPSRLCEQPPLPWALQMFLCPMINSFVILLVASVFPKKLKTNNFGYTSSHISTAANIFLHLLPSNCYPHKSTDPRCPRTSTISSTKLSTVCWQSVGERTASVWSGFSWHWGSSLLQLDYIDISTVMLGPNYFLIPRADHLSHCGLFAFPTLCKKTTLTPSCMRLPPLTFRTISYQTARLIPRLERYVSSVKVWESHKMSIYLICHGVLVPLIALKKTFSATFVL